MRSKQNRIITLQIEEFSIEVTFKKIKTLHLTVRPPQGEVRISAPVFISEKELCLFATAKLPWIRKHAERFQNRKPQLPLLYTTGEKIRFRGKSYTLQLIYSSGNKAIQIQEETIILPVGKEYSSQKRETLIKEWMRQDLKTRIAPLVSYWSSRVGITPSFWGIRKMKTKWGSCHTTKRRIWLNLDLAMEKESLLEYVVIHEMAHLLEGNHGTRFKKLMDDYLPEWRNLKRELNSHTF